MHPDKNMGSPLASESFKKLQCAYEVNESSCFLDIRLLRIVDIDSNGC